MENYDSIITRLNKQVNEFAPRSSTSIISNNNSMFQWKQYYIYILIPVLVSIVLLIWRPDFLMYKNDKDKRVINFKKFCLTVVIVSILLCVGYIYYQFNYNN